MNDFEITNYARLNDIQTKIATGKGNEDDLKEGLEILDKLNLSWQKGHLINIYSHSKHLNDLEESLARLESLVLEGDRKS